MVPSTGRRPVDATSPGGGLEGGVPPPESEKNEIRKTLDVIWWLMEVKFIE